MKIDRILCPLDFSDQSQAALDNAEGLATTFGAELIVLHVVEPVLYPVAYGLTSTVAVDLSADACKGAERALAPVVEALLDRGVRAAPLVAEGRASGRICELVDERDIDLVVMATQGLTGVKHLLIGSTAERVVRHCSCPVMTVKNKG
ncbi:MAG: universal stress protein A [Pseudohongiellaceae bacterium]|jgi:universal stress protein A